MTQDLPHHHPGAIHFEAIREHNDASSTPHVITYDKILFNIGAGAMNITSGTFVVPENAWYRFEFDGLIKNSAVNITMNKIGAVSTERVVLLRVMDVLPTSWHKYIDTTFNVTDTDNITIQSNQTVRPLSSVLTVDLKENDSVFLRQETLGGFYFESNGSTRLRFSGKKFSS
jgi:hypothetical protein